MDHSARDRLDDAYRLAQERFNAEAAAGATAVLQEGRASNAAGGVTLDRILDVHVAALFAAVDFLGRQHAAAGHRNADAISARVDGFVARQVFHWPADGADPTLGARGAASFAEFINVFFRGAPVLFRVMATLPPDPAAARPPPPASPPEPRRRLARWVGRLLGRAPS